jgi:hypothetical protein
MNDVIDHLSFALRVLFVLLVLFRSDHKPCLNGNMKSDGGWLS